MKAVEEIRNSLASLALISSFLLQPLALVPFFGWLLFFTRFSFVSLGAIAVWAAIRISVLAPGGPLRLGVRWRWFADLPFWAWVARHYRVSVEYNGPRLDPARHFIFSIHPHGVFALERYMLWASRSDRWDKLFPGIDTRDLVATSLLLVPGSGLWCLATGCVPADRATAKAVLTRTPNSLLLYPGGEKEQLATMHGRHIAWVKQRKGFCRLSLEHGAPILPIYVFGASDQYLTSDALMGFRQWVQSKFQIALPIFRGHPFFFWMPNGSAPLTMVIGDPIEVERVEHPTDGQVDALLAKYVNSLVDLFDRNKDRCGFSGAVLEVM